MITAPPLAAASWKVACRRTWTSASGQQPLAAANPQARRYDMSRTESHSERRTHDRRRARPHRSTLPLAVVLLRRRRSASAYKALGSLQRSPSRQWLAANAASLDIADCLRGRPAIANCTCTKQQLIPDCPFHQPNGPLSCRPSNPKPRSVEAGGVSAKSLMNGVASQLPGK